MASPSTDPGARTAASLRVAAGVVALLLGLLILWLLADVVLVAFAAALMAIVLRALARQIERHTPLSRRWALVVAVAAVCALIAAFVFLLGAQLYAQSAGLVERVPQLFEKLADRLQIESLRDLTRDALPRMLDGEAARKVAVYSSRVAEVATLAVLVVVAAVYLAADSHLYRRGLLLVLPPRWRREGTRLMQNIGHALERWLLGQLVAMVAVGVMTSVGLALIGVPGALALGFLAGIADFVPLIGPILAAVPAVLIALGEGGTMVFWVIALYLVVQQVEGNLIMPLVQRRAVRLPPALSLFSILVFGVLFGPLGVLLAVPLAVVAYVAVRQLYLRRYLGEDISVPGETPARRAAAAADATALPD
jgi:predicted PurR-regulated permease PerM